MKKIINGKLYDTETAEYVGGYRKNGTSIQDFNYVCKDIYRTSKGQFFEYVEGGANSPYGSKEGRTWYAAEHLNLMEPEEVLKWLEENSVYLSEEKMTRFLSFFEVENG